MRVAIYTRISTDEEHQPYSLEAQDTRLGGRHEVPTLAQGSEQRAHSR